MSNNHLNGTLQQSNKTLTPVKKSENELKGSQTKKIDDQIIYLNINGTKYTAIIHGNKLNNLNNMCNCKCNCSYGPHDSSEELVHLYAFDDDYEDPDMNVDDIDELEQIEKPYKCIELTSFELLK